MKKYFKSQMEAIQWISDNAQNEAHFEILREELIFNHIYTGEYFVHMVLLEEDVVWLNWAVGIVLFIFSSFDELYD